MLSSIYLTGASTKRARTATWLQRIPIERAGVAIDGAASSIERMLTPTDGTRSAIEL